VNADPRFAEFRRSGDRGVRNKLVEDHLDLARGLARRYRHRGVAKDDLEQVARVGLIGAVERFDPDQGVRFQTFAARTIDGELKRHFRDKAWQVRVPRRQQELTLAVRSTIEELTNRLGRVPSAQEVARQLQVDLDEVLAAIEASQAFRADSLDRPTGTDGPDATSHRRLEDSLAATDHATLEFEDQQLVGSLLVKLPERERQIVERRFFGEQSQRSIAEELGISQMHVSRLLRSALLALRQSLPSDQTPC